MSRARSSKHHDISNTGILTIKDFDWKGPIQIGVAWAAVQNVGCVLHCTAPEVQQYATGRYHAFHHIDHYTTRL